MFFVKYLDQKQGEARVVDQQQLIRQRLEAFLARRPSAEQLLEQGILGRQERFGLAQQVVDELLRSRLKAQEEELERPPAGEWSYNDQSVQLLRVDRQSLESKLQELQKMHERKMAEMKAMEQKWQEAAAECQRQSSSPVVPQLIDRVKAAGELLSQHRDLKEGPLAGVFLELQSFQKLLRKRRALQDIVHMAQRSDAAREAVFSSFGQSADIQVEELLQLCNRLPPRSKAVGMKRLRFIMEPLKRNLTQELQDLLQPIWPKEPGNSKVPVAAAPLLDLCRRLSEAQRVESQLKEVGDENDVAPGLTPLWACEALAAPLIARFRHHFCRTESELCRMDKPEWAFRYLTDLATEHLTDLEGWLQVTPNVEGEALLKGLAMSLAQEGRFFLRLRMPSLAKDADCKAFLYHTLQQLVKFHSSMSSLGGIEATEVLMKDFDTNRPLEETAASPRPQQVEGGLIAARLARLAGPGPRVEEQALGFLDVWASADATFITEKLEAALLGAAWRSQPLDVNVDNGPEIFSLATLVVDLLSRAAERCGCLATTWAISSYCKVVLAPGVQQSAKALKQRWNDMEDPLKVPKEVGRLQETLQELVVFLDAFPLAQYMVPACDELRELQVLIQKKLRELQSQNSDDE